MKEREYTDGPESKSRIYHFLRHSASQKARAAFVHDNYEAPEFRSKIPILMADSLTKKQRMLQKELAEIAEIVRVDYWNILDWERDARTPTLEVMRRELVRGEVVGQYTLIDDLLSTELCKYFLPGRSIIAQWKTKRFRRFNYYILERLYLTQKLALIKEVYSLPKGVTSTIEEINALRNAMAHAFFPENLRAYQMKGRPGPRKPITVRYKGQDVFTVPGVQRFVDDCRGIVDFLLWKMKRRKRQGAQRREDFVLFYS